MVDHAVNPAFREALNRYLRFLAAERGGATHTVKSCREDLLQLIDYLEDDSIELDIWPNCGRATVTKDEVIEAALSGNLFSPKTSRHRLSDHLPPIAVPISRLRKPAI